ncbi:MAG: hypothetical protein LC796_15305 [Acidobacteria bacterium]|nr:hypothetical protein [Acidobacteriota bacterium]MCA1609284.1 hypothetical protein [Acidobacteriota bacterium]
MKSSRKVSFGLAAAGVFALAVLLALTPRPDAPAPSGSLGAPVFGDAFWKRWGDGKGELAGYDLAFPRYGQARKGVAVTIFVTETFSNSLRVKSDPGKHPASDEFPVMKLNLVEDFQTGIYDYNLLTSAFVALVPVNGRPAGSATKVSFSSQEWCGGVFGQLLFDAASARLTTHSYFDGEADQSRAVPAPADALAGDAILLWARGFAAPALNAGERHEVPFVRSIETSRLTHRAVETARVTLSRAAAPSRVTVPAGTFEVERRVAEIAGGPTWKIDVEAAEPHRIIAWETSEGRKASLLASDRLEYWKLHGEGQESFLARIGLKPRPPRTP